MEQPTYDASQVQHALELAQTPAGKAILEQLRRQHGEELRSAAESGNVDKLRTLIQDFLRTPEAQALRTSLENR